MVVTFRTAAFNTTEPPEGAVNPEAFGDDVAAALIKELIEQGIVTADSPEAEDFGWYFTFTVGEHEHCFVVGFRPNDDRDHGTWIGWVERTRGFWTSLMGRRAVGVTREALGCIHAAIASLPDVASVTWHDEKRFRAGDERSGVAHPHELLSKD